jgi:hypothetical protein
MGTNNTKNSSLKCDFLIFNFESESCFYCKKTNTKFDQKTVSLLCVKMKSGAHKQLTFLFQLRKYFCRHLHSSLISMVYYIVQILHRSGSVLLDPGLRRYSIKMTGVDPLVQKEKQICFFGAKMAPCLWRADPSFMNSVAGSGNKAKCSNILQDRFILHPTFFGVRYLFECHVSTGIALLIP